MISLAGILALVAASSPALLSPGQPGRHEPWLREVKSAGVNALRHALQTYDAWLRAHPADASAAVERCRLIAGTEGDEEGPLDPEGPTHAACLEELERRFPEAPAAVLYQLDHRWMAGAIAFGERALANRRILFTDAQRARVHEKLALAQQASRHPDAAVREARQAMGLDRSIDLTDLLGEVFLAQGRKAEAVAALSARVEGPPFRLQAKAGRLADAGAFFRAQWMLAQAAGKPGFTPDAELKGRIYEGTGKLREASEAYRKGLQAWRRVNMVPRLFELALAGGDAAAADRAYQELRDQGFKADPIARHRLALQWRFPQARWRARDLAGIAGLLASILGLSLLPVLVFLPLHSFTLWRRSQRPAPVEPGAPGEWWFRHVYLVLALNLCTQFIALYVFRYEELQQLLAPGKDPGPVPGIARFGILYATLQAAGLLLLLLHRPQRVRLLGRGSWSLRKCAGMALVALLVGFLTGGLSNAVFRRAAAITTESLVRSLAQTYGLASTLLVAALLIPICEELIFRSVLLDVFARHLRFWVANLLQAALFAAMHGDPLRLLLYGVMGLLAGGLRRSSGGLLASILFHVINNVIAVLILTSSANLGVKKAAPAGPRLVACASASAIREDSSVSQLNSLAWRVAIDRKASRDCLLEAEAAVEGALQAAPDLPAFLDTKATVLFREGRLEEAIDLESAAFALDRARMPIYLSQLDRFVRARQAGDAPVLLGGAEKAVTFSMQPDGKALIVELKAPLEEGFLLLARQAGGPSLLRLAAGPGHERSYRIETPQSAGSAYELAFLDARGCDGCKPGAWEYFVSPRDPTVDTYP